MAAGNDQAFSCLTCLIQRLTDTTIVIVQRATMYLREREREREREQSLVTRVRNCVCVCDQP